LKLDRYLLGELAEVEAAGVRAHVAGCDACRAALEAMRPEPLPPLRVVPLPLQRPRRWPRIAAAAAGLAAAAGVLLVVQRPAGERTKGPGFSLSMYVQHGGDVRLAAPGEQVAAGDAVRFAVSAPSATYVAVLSVDPRDSAGEERVVGLFCSSPVAIEPVRAALQRGGDFVPDGCQVTRWSFTKR